MKPILLHYFITNRCNAKCSFCSIWSDSPKADEKKEDVKRNLIAARNEGCRFVDFTGGEPLLHSDLPYFLREAKKLGFITSVTTNCILFPSRVNELEGLIDLLHFSIDADSPELHDTIRGVKSFSHVMESIPLALSYNLIPDLLFTYTDENIDYFEGIYRLGLSYKLIVILDPVFYTNGPDRLKRSTHIKALNLSRKRGVYLNRAHLSIRFAGGNHIRNPLCRVVDSTVVLIPQSQRVYPCFHHRCMFSTYDKEGNSEENQKELFFEARRMQGRYSFCEGCHLNCYLDPSYNFVFNRLFFQSLGAKFNYIIMKYFYYGNFKPFLRLFYPVMNRQ